VKKFPGIGGAIETVGRMIEKIIPPDEVRILRAKTKEKFRAFKLMLKGRYGWGWRFKRKNFDYPEKDQMK